MQDDAIRAVGLAYTFQRSGSSGEDIAVLRGLDLAVARGEVVSVFGPNGCGKSTLIRLCAGLLRPASGHLTVTGLPPDQVPVGYIPQKFGESLFPWLTNLDNIAFPLYTNGLSKSRARAQAAEAAARVSAELALDRHPFEMSVGQQQMVALARAIVLSPKVLLADEPFSALDFQARIDLLDVFHNVLSPATGVGALLISHNIEDAVYLGDRVVVTSRLPMQILKSFDVSAPRPRQKEFRNSETFLRLVGVITEEFLKGRGK